MIIRERLFPYPVLRVASDDVMPNRFVMSVSASHDADMHYVEIAFEHDNGSLDELIETGRATYAVHVECRRNFYREMHYSAERLCRLSIPAVALVGKVEVSGFVVARHPMAEYRIGGAHPDYGAATFGVGVGDVLAVAESWTFDAHVDYDPLKSIASILTIQRSEVLADGPMSVDSLGDRIIVVLSQRDYDRYRDLKGDPKLGPLLANQVVVPVLVDLVGQMTGASDDVHEEDMGKRWYRSVIRKLEGDGCDLRGGKVTALEATQRLLQQPLRRSLESIVSLLPEEDDS